MTGDDLSGWCGRTLLRSTSVHWLFFFLMGYCSEWAILFLMGHPAQGPRTKRMRYRSRIHVFFYFAMGIG